ncbi:protein translocase subunit SecF [Rhodocaloribacter litoris]|uniref:protein translocase subunit SecF n=1 Tax=Rhodocaloribacter litoris TaxID=2558931 RepID=UPI001422F49F|nr:protein translocase subunit SecF [Rhodocaloribacter litoris]QXD14907.1 protein translocase subunit SecF [Rhodocaloribacter litoris]GIV58996.1 MAG: protein-export membrane protein SecF [Rhodothermaceae bacterium]
MRIFENTQFDFIRSRTKGYLFSGVLLLISVVSFFVHGLELGIDFRGGMEFVVESDQELSTVRIRGILADALGADPEVKTFGENALLVRTLAEGEITQKQQQIIEAIAGAYPEANPRVVKTDIVGPRFAEDLKRGAIYAVLGSLLVIFLYILIRFEWRFGVGAVAALFHDVTITLGVFSLLHGFLPFSLQIDQAIIAAFLTIVGYSLNDTVVIFDRIREYTTLFKTEPYDQVVNRSINNTLSRTVITSGTTLLVVVTLFIFGGEVLRGFAFALIVGILIGTYSSIFVASPIVVELRQQSATRR